MKKRSFFERLTGSVKMEEDDDQILSPKTQENNWAEDGEEEAQLTVDVYQTSTDIIIQTMIAGVKAEDLSVETGRDMVTIKGKREENKTINEEDKFISELYWGSFSRTILLPQEIEPDEAEAAEKHGLLIIKLPKIDKAKKTNLRVKSI